MNGTVCYRRLLACAALLAGGCGAIPDIIVEAARSSAKKAIQEAVEDVIDDVIDDTADELFDYVDVESLFIPGSEEEEEGDVFEEAGKDADDSDQYTGRTGRTAWDRRRHDSSHPVNSRLPFSATHDVLAVDMTQRATNSLYKT